MYFAIVINCILKSIWNRDHFFIESAKPSHIVEPSCVLAGAYLAQFCNF